MPADATIGEASAVISEKERVVNIVNNYLHEVEERINNFGSGLSGFEKLNHKIIIYEEVEYDFGWVFMYNTEKFVKAGDFREALLGNGALIVDRFNGQMYTTGSAYPIAFYIAEFRKGGSEFVRLHSPQEK